MSVDENETPALVIRYRGLKRTMTQQVPWDKIQNLQRGNLYMTLPNNDHFHYVEKFSQPLLIEPEPGTIGVVSLSVLMDGGKGRYRIVKHWRIIRVKLSESMKDWILTLGDEII